MSQAKANTIRIQTTVSLYSIIDNSCYISLVSCLFFRYLTDNNTYFNESVVRWSNCEQFYLQIDHHLNNLPLFIYWTIIAVILSDRRQLPSQWLYY